MNNDQVTGFLARWLGRKPIGVGPKYMASYGRCLPVAGVVFAIALILLAVPARAEPFDLEPQDDVKIDLTTAKDPTLDLRLQRTGDSLPGTSGEEVVLSLKAETPLGPACDFIARSGFPGAPGETAVVTFTVRSADDCDLSALHVDEVKLSSTAIDDANVTAELTKKPSFPLSEYSRALTGAALTAAAIVALATLLAWNRWATTERKDDRFWAHPLDSPTLTWSFNESWLTNLTALGALLATLLGLTDVLDIIGPGKPDRAVFLLVNFAGLALAASSLIAYQALRGYTLTTKKNGQVPLRLQVRASRSGGNRELTVEVPTIRYTADEDGQLTRTSAFGPAATKQWTNSGHHVAVVAVPAAVTNTSNGLAPPPASVALEIPSAGNHAPDAVLFYNTSIAELGTVAGSTYVPATIEESRTKPHGRMVGFVVAALFASVGVAIQLASIYKVLDRSTVTAGAREAGIVVLVVLVAAAAAYVVATILTRLPEVESVEPKEASATASLQVHGPDLPTEDMPDEPVVASAVLNATDAGQFRTLEDIMATSTGDTGTAAYPMRSYAYVRTSPGDEIIDVRPRRGETAF